VRNDPLYALAGGWPRAGALAVIAGQTCRRGKRTAFVGHPRTADGELRVEIQQVREAAEPFVSPVFPTWLRPVAVADLVARSDGGRRCRDGE
jgi:hypothetical protein